MVKRYNYPDRSGKIDIFPEIYEGNVVSVTIIGDQKGLKYLAEVLLWLADVNQEDSDDPIGTREHIHIHRNEQLGDNSCEVEICRADAKGTGELPEYMRES
ncbi:MAG: Imm32 family immunity protein [Planctomycetota bacterium]|jgi:hypothetical protein